MAPNKKKNAMSMAELSKMFGGNPNQGALPTRSEGKEETRGRRDDRRGRDDDEFGGGGWRNEDRGGRFGGDRGGGRFGDRDDRDWRGGGRDGGRGGGGNDDWKAMLSGRGGGGSSRPGAGSSMEDRRSQFGAGVRAKLRGEAPDEPVQSSGSKPFQPQQRRAPPPPKEEKAKKPIFVAKKVEEPVGPIPDEELLNDFRAEVTEMWDRQNFSDLKDLPDMTDAEFGSGMVCKIVAQNLMRCARGKQPEQISKLIADSEAMFDWLWENDTRRRVKVEFLFDLQEAVFQQKCPRLSPEWALIEAVFDGLYFNQVLAEPYFFLWADDTKDTRDGKIEVMFQANAWLDWLKKAKAFGEETSDSEDESGSGSEEEDEDKEEEELVPLGGAYAGRKLMAVAR